MGEMEQRWKVQIRGTEHDVVAREVFIKSRTRPPKPRGISHQQTVASHKREYRHDPLDFSVVQYWNACRDDSQQPTLPASSEKDAVRAAPQSKNTTSAQPKVSLALILGN